MKNVSDTKEANAGRAIVHGFFRLDLLEGCMQSAQKARMRSYTKIPSAGQLASR